MDRRCRDRPRRAAGAAGVGNAGAPPGPARPPGQVAAGCVRRRAATAAAPARPGIAAVQERDLHAAEKRIALPHRCHRVGDGCEKLLDGLLLGRARQRRGHHRQRGAAKRRLEVFALAARPSARDLPCPFRSAPRPSRPDRRRNGRPSSRASPRGVPAGTSPSDAATCRRTVGARVVHAGGDGGRDRRVAAPRASVRRAGPPTGARRPTTSSRARTTSAAGSASSPSSVHNACSRVRGRRRGPSERVERRHDGLVATFDAAPAAPYRATTRSDARAFARAPRLTPSTGPDPDRVAWSRASRGRCGRGRSAARDRATRSDRAGTR